jgi:hypothetical protein
VNLSFIGDKFGNHDFIFWYDASVPSNRRLDKTYEKGENFVTVIDFYLSSPQIEVVSCKTIDLNFANSDHQPVILTFRFN